MMEFATPNKEALVRLVQKCLSDNSDGYVERDQFIEFCSKLSVSTDELDCVFNELDNDGDGRINVSDFTTSFEQLARFKCDGSSDETNIAIGESIDRSLYECQGNSLESPMQSISTTG
jgi:Ca2+-binding EF-hand superfamily protein